MDSAPGIPLALRHALAGLERGSAPQAADLFPLGAPALDASLGGGLSRVSLHEIHAVQGLADAVAAGSFGLGLALRAAEERPLVWVRQDFVDAETGGLYGAGLAAFGLDPRRLLLVRAGDATGVLRAANEATRCPALGAVLVELWGEPKSLDLTVSRRLLLAAARSGVTLFLIRLGATPQPSAAATRWAVQAAASVPLEANAPGRPAFAATLLRHRAGIAGQTWNVEWDRDRLSFADPAPLPRSVSPLSAGRTRSAEREAIWRAG
ncbi:MAG TPA: hypothetical protein VGN97_12500 [Mesorhizobium sp.]|jgi:protein ImuA|nr:hypothetical protein [Mesorhizobium sp.]